METNNTYSNPIAGSNLIVTKLLRENRADMDKLRADESFVLDCENEFYLLFTNGVLLIKEKSKFRTSDYLTGKKFEGLWKRNKQTK